MTITSSGVLRWLGSHRIDLLACGSTNDEAARLSRAGARHGTIVLAESQHAGRGRDGRVWASPKGLGLYLSMILRPPLPLALVPPMTLAIGVALCDAVRSTGADAELKWPNDILVRGKKLAGVLVEAQSQGTKLEAVIVGIGVNLGGDLPESVATTGITLEEAAGHVASPGSAGARSNADALRSPIDREKFLATLLEHLEHWIDRYVANGLPSVSSAWQDRMAKNLIARAHAVGDADAIVGEVSGLDGDGALLLRDVAGTVHRVRSGDVEVMRDTLAEPAAPAC